mgnify:CR=1 FL=1
MVSSKTQQNFKIDIEEIYNDFIKTIDNFRSEINISNGKNQEIFNSYLVKSSLEKKSLDSSLIEKLKPEKNGESRCHAFFRMIGFPICGKEGTNDFYNPSLNNIIDKDNTITNDRKLTIMKSLVPKFREISNFREKSLSDFAQIFQSNDSIDASTLSLTVEARINQNSNFALTKENYKFLNPLDKEDQSYKVDFSKLGLVGDRTISLLQYCDNTGLSPVKLGNTTKRYHIIIPFMVDPWIDFSVCPNSKLIAVPFVPSKRNLLLGVDTYVKRPLLEMVIRDRFTPNSEILKNSGSYSQKFQEFIKETPSIKDVELINSIKGDDTLIEQQHFKRFINIISVMMTELIKAHNIIKKIQTKYYWLPIPSVTGPENGASIKPIMHQISKTTEDRKLITEEDNDLLIAIIKDVMNQSNQQVANISGTPDVGEYIFDNQFTFSPETTKAYGNINRETIENKTQIRDDEMNEANKALRTIEIIMGEFSGFGLCDIIAIYGALYITPKNTILRFLDDDAFIRAKKELPGISMGITDLLTISQTLDSFTNVVIDFYRLMDKMYSDISKSNK